MSEERAEPRGITETIGKSESFERLLLCKVLSEEEHTEACVEVEGLEILKSANCVSNGPG